MGKYRIKENEKEGNTRRENEKAQRKKCGRVTKEKEARHITDRDAEGKSKGREEETSKIMERGKE